MNYIKKEDAVALSEALSLHATGFEQDWDIELADDARLKDFIDLYLSGNLTDSQKAALMALIVSSFDKGLQHSSFDEGLWSIAKGLLRRDLALHADLLDYWAQSSCDDDTFLMTSKIRDLLAGQAAAIDSPPSQPSQ